MTIQQTEDGTAAGPVNRDQLESWDRDHFFHPSTPRAAHPLCAAAGVALE